MCRLTVLVALVIVGVGFAASLSADTLTFNLNPAFFGNLDQANTNCPEANCGPSAAVNSFVFLQNRYPSIYGNLLVPALQGGNPTQADMVEVANTLTEFMNPCGCSDGTAIEDFIFGKSAYIDSVAPGTTTFAAQTTAQWRNPTPGGTTAQKPAYVQDLTRPTLQFIFDQLKDSEDVEIFVTFVDVRFKHYLTVTGMTWDTATNTGSFNLVDPLGGNQIASNFELDTLGFVFLKDYGGGVFISNAVSESPLPAPVPEPGTIVLFSLGMALLTPLRRARLTARR